MDNFKDYARLKDLAGKIEELLLSDYKEVLDEAYDIAEERGDNDYRTEAMNVSSDGKVLDFYRSYPYDDYEIVDVNVVEIPSISAVVPDFDAAIERAIDFLQGLRK